MSANHCTGAVTFNEVYSNAYSEWPDNLPGVICKTPPVGPGSASRFAQCCSGPVYNITAPTTPDDPAYPVSCATLCQVDPALDASNKNNPYGWSDFFMCLIDGGRLNSDGETVCGTVTAKNGESAPSTFASTPTWAAWTSYYTSVVYSTDDSDHTSYMDPITFWEASSDIVPGVHSTATGDESSAAHAASTGTSETTATSTATSSEMAVESSTAEASQSPSTTTAPTSSSTVAEESTTPTSRGTSLVVDRLTAAFAVLGILCAVL